MNEFVSLMWESMKDRLYVTPEEFEANWQGWEFDPWRRKDGSIWALFVVNGPEFHFLTFGDASFTREHVRKYPGSLIEKYGYALTRTPKEDTRQRRFNERLGFVQVGEDEFDVHYRIERMKVRTSCHSS